MSDSQPQDSCLPGLYVGGFIGFTLLIAADRPSLVLVGTVSSRRLILESTIRARSGLADVVLMLDGMVAGGEYI